MMLREAARRVRPSTARRPSTQAKRTIPCATRSLPYQGHPLVVGIINVTPDSFSDGGRYAKPEAARRLAEQMAAAGAAAVDVGGESTRPGAGRVSVEEELSRVIPAIRKIRSAVDLPISIDTSKAEVARQALEAGADLVNDVTALSDPDMAEVVAGSGAGIILMHMQGTPRTMQRRPAYGNVAADVAGWLLAAAGSAAQAGISQQRIILDPGLGFGKTVRHNLQLLRHLRSLVELGFPVMVGPSRKSFIGTTLDAAVEDRLAGTLACVAQAAFCGAHFVRVHDVQPAVELVRMLASISAA
jgi:dihydropteroate synthase